MDAGQWEGLLRYAGPGSIAYQQIPSLRNIRTVKRENQFSVFYSLAGN